MLSIFIFSFHTCNILIVFCPRYYHFIEKSNDIDVVFAVEGFPDTTGNSHVMSRIKQFMSASLDYFTLSGDSSHVGLFTFGSSKESSSKIHLNLREGRNSKIARFAIQNFRRRGDNEYENQPQKVNVLEMLNTAQQDMFAPHGREQTKKLLIVFATSATRSQLMEGAEVVKKLKEMKNKPSIQTAVVLLDSPVVQLQDFDRLRSVIGNSLLLVRNDGQSLPNAFPDFEKLIANIVGMYRMIAFQ